MPDDEAGRAVVGEHERRLTACDPLLPTSFPLPEPGPGDAMLTVDGAVAASRVHHIDQASFLASWGAAAQHQLTVRVGGSDPVGAMDAVLGQWRDRVLAQAAPDDPEAEATVTWPSRDTAMTGVLLAHGLTPAAVIAARPAGRPGPGSASAVGVRPITVADLDTAAELWLAEVRWDAQFGAATQRPSTLGAIRRELSEVLSQQQPWAWVAEDAGEVSGLLVVSPPARAGWAAPLTSAGPTGYLDCLVVGADRRGGGVGAALVGHAHAALDWAGVAVTVLHYAAMNPLSGPFWHRCGYRPLWTIWHTRPASWLR